MANSGGVSRLGVFLMRFDANSPEAAGGTGTQRAYGAPSAGLATDDAGHRTLTRCDISNRVATWKHYIRPILGWPVGGSMAEDRHVRDKRERFVALAEARTEKALAAIRLIGNLSNRANYEYSENDVAQITRALDRETRLLKDRFQSAGSPGGVTFRLHVARKPAAS